MMSFLSSFSSSFLLALLAWPFIAALLTLPILLVQYRTFNRIHWRRILGIYLFVLYGLGLLSFTLYPMPDNPAEFCQAYHLAPQLTPLTFIHDITSDGMRAIFQVGMNIVFFIPLGIFARLLFRWKIIPTIIIGVLTSLTIETAQLTGAFGFYPCSYRLFDVDDLMINTFGALLGFILALIVPKSELEKAEKGSVVTEAGALRRLVGFTADILLSQAATLLVTVPIYLIDRQLAIDIQPAISILMIIVFQFILPLVGHGKTPGGHLVRMSLDDTPRPGMKRLVFYALRLIWIGAFLLGQGLVPILIGLITATVWLAKKRLPYRII